MEKFEVPKSFNSVNALVDRIRDLVGKFRMKVEVQDTSVKVNGITVHYFSDGVDGKTHVTDALEAFLHSANDNKNAPAAIISTDAETGAPMILARAA